MPAVRLCIHILQAHMASTCWMLASARQYNTCSRWQQCILCTWQHRGDHKRVCTHGCWSLLPYQAAYQAQSLGQGGITCTQMVALPTRPYLEVDAAAAAASGRIQGAMARHATAKGAATVPTRVTFQHLVSASSQCYRLHEHACVADRIQAAFDLDWCKCSRLAPSTNSSRS